MSHKKVTEWAPRLEVLGLTLDTEAMMNSLPAGKVVDLRERLAVWPATRRAVTVKEVLVLAGKLRHAAICCTNRSVCYRRRF